MNWNANDSSNYWNNGTPYNIAWDDWWDWWCASFNGSNSKINIPSLTAENNFTMSFWMKTTQSSRWEIVILWDSSSKTFEVRNYTSKLQLEIWNNWWWSWNTIYSTSTINTWNWIHVCITKEWTSFKIYIMWIQEASMTSSKLMTWTNNRIWLHSNWSSDPYNWFIDNFIIEKIVRNSDEALKYVNKTKSKYWY